MRLRSSCAASSSFCRLSAIFVRPERELPGDRLHETKVGRLLVVATGPCRSTTPQSLLLHAQHGQRRGAS